MITKPMLAASFDDFAKQSLKIVFPLLGSQKMDGIRALKLKGRLLSRTFKPIKNIYIRTKLEADLPDNVDGELMDVRGWEYTQSSVMREEGEPDFRYYVFDYVKDTLDKPYKDRIKDLEALVLPSYCIKVIPKEINNHDELLALEEEFINEGYEGLMLRRPDSKYKCGRGTIKAMDLVKVKRFIDAEAIVEGYEEQMENTNEATEDELGHTKRSSAKAGMVPKGILGKWKVRGINGQFAGVSFGLGTAKNVTIVMRKEWWDNRDTYLGKFVTYKYQAVGSVDAPRIPVFKWFRDPSDFETADFEPYIRDIIKAWEQKRN